MTTLNHHPVKLVATGGSKKEGLVSFGKTVTTTDNTATDIHAIPLSEGEAIHVRVTVVGKIADLSAAAGNHAWVVARRAAAGNVTIVGSSQGTTQEDSAGTPAIAFAADTTNQTVDIRVTGITAETWTWECSGEYLKV